MGISVAIVEDNALFAEAVRVLLGQSDELRCIAVCPSAENALAILPALRPQVVLMDIQLPEASGVQCIRQLKPLLPDTRFLVLSISEDSEHVYQAMAAGAAGYLSKRARPAEMLAAIRDPDGGNVAMSAAVARKLVASLNSFLPSADQGPVLSPEEGEILAAFAAGRRCDEICAQLGLNTAAVHDLVLSIYRKLQARLDTRAGHRSRPLR